MSNRNLARRAAVGISFSGTDITKSIRPYLKAFIYTDNEADEADDIQIQLHDRDTIWMEKWLNEAIDAASKIGDDYLQKKAYGREMPESFNHGRSEWRVRWLSKGLRSGDPLGGDTFSISYSDL